MAKQTYFNSFQSICNRKAAIVLALVDIMFGLVSLFFHCLRLNDLKEVSKTGHHLYYWVFQDSHYEFETVNAKAMLVSYYRVTIGCSACYLMISAILLYGALARKVLACKVWIGLMSTFFVAAMMLYILIFLRPTSVLYLLVIIGTMYKMFEILVVANFIKAIKKFAAAEIVANVEFGTLSKDSEGDLQYTYSSGYMSITPLVEVPQQLSQTQGLQFDPTRVNAYVYQDAFHTGRNAGSSSCIYLNQNMQMTSPAQPLNTQQLQNGSSIILKDRPNGVGI